MKILQIDGGGCKGVIPAIVLSRLEELMGKRCCEVFDQITGTSTGAIIGGALAWGMEAKRIEQLYREVLPELFKFNPLYLLTHGVKYDRRKFIAALEREIMDSNGLMVGDMGGVKTKLVVTAFNLCSGRTHFIQSDNAQEKRIRLVDAISWSALSAAFYFGKIVEPKFTWSEFRAEGYYRPQEIKGAAFQDGGQGVNNCTLEYNLIETLARASRDKTIIVSLGCGDPSMVRPLDDVKNFGTIRQIGAFSKQARSEATQEQVMGGCYVSEHNPNVTVYRINITIPEKIDKLDGVRHIPEYINIGKYLAENKIDQSLVNFLLKGDENGKS
jgi:patatin-like phospholipase/acyl hydrolase